MADRVEIIRSRGTYCGGERIAIVGGAAAISLTPPKGALYALASIEADATAVDTSKAVRFDEGGNASGIAGHILGDGAFIEFFGANMSSVNFAGIEAGKTNSIQISYYF